MSSACYQSVQEKMGDSARLAVADLLVSEYNTRCSFVDADHVEHLAGLIQERGFHPTRAISVNIIQNAAGEPVTKRVVAGRHRLEAAKLVGLSHVPCVQYCGLTDEEETLLDRWDNEMDEEHKPVHFLDEAEHYRFLKKIKGWSVRQIARNKNTDRNTVFRRLKFAEISSTAKHLIRGVSHGRHPAERHLRDICKLKDPDHIILIIKEIIQRGQAEEAEEVDEGGVPVRAMKQKEVGNRVAELLKLESKEDESLVKSEDIAATEPDTQQGGQHVAHPTESPSEKSKSAENRTQPTPLVAMQANRPSLPSAVGGLKDEEAALAEIHQQRIAKQMSNGSLGVDSEKRSTAAMKFDVVPRWLKCSSFPHKMKALWPLFEFLVRFEMRYLHGVTSTNKEDGYFFIGGSESSPEWTCQFLGRMLGLEPATVQKKLRALESYELIKVERANLPRYPRFQIRWDHIKKLYDEESWSISFEEGGLAQLPLEFSGQVEPTPLHTIWVRDGIVSQGVDHGVKETMEELKGLGASNKFARRILNENYLGTLRQVLVQLPSAMESYQERSGETIRKPLDFFLGCLKAAKKNQDEK